MAEIIFVRLRIDTNSSDVVEAQVFPAQDAMAILEKAEPKQDSSIEAIITNLIAALETNTGWSRGIQQELALKLATAYGYITPARRKTPEIVTRDPDLLALYLIDPLDKGESNGR